MDDFWSLPLALSALPCLIIGIRGMMIYKATDFKLPLSIFAALAGGTTFLSAMVNMLSLKG